VKRINAKSQRRRDAERSLIRKVGIEEARKGMGEQPRHEGTKRTDLTANGHEWEIRASGMAAKGSLGVREIKMKIRRGKRTSHLTPAQWLPKPATSQLPKLGCALRALWSPTKRCGAPSGVAMGEMISALVAKSHMPNWRAVCNRERKGVCCDKKSVNKISDLETLTWRIRVR
jgi:hypothetical protein